jgi:hypothetical protein
MSELDDLLAQVGSKKNVALDTDAARKLEEEKALKRQGERNAAVNAVDKARNAADYKAQLAENAKNEAKFGTSDTGMLRKLEGQGPFDEHNFALLAKEDPEAANKQLDSIEETLGMRKPAGGGAQDATGGAAIRRGTQHIADGRDIPYFTNLPGAAGSQGGPMENVSDLALYNAGPAGTGGDWATSNDPVKRAVARKIADARNVVKLGEKGEGYVGKKVASMVPQAEQDVTDLGSDAASAKWMAGVEKGDYPLGVVHQLTSYTKDKAAQAEDAQYETKRDQVMQWARWNGADQALARIHEERQAGTGNPKHLAAIEKEVRAKMRPSTDKNAVMSPYEYLPATAQDVETWTGKDAQPDYVEDPFKPAHIGNPKGTEPVPNVVADKHQAATGALLDTVTNAPSIGAPARTAYSYTAGAGGTQNSGAHGTVPSEASKVSKGPGFQIGGDFLDAGPSAGEEAGYGKGPWGALTGAGAALGEFMQGVSGGAEGPLTREQRLRHEAVRRARGY